MNTSAITIISLLLLIGAMAKSSQIFLHNWLPGSMEGEFNQNYFLILIKPLDTLYLYERKFFYKYKITWEINN
jgi:hypothetical protein